MNRERLVQYTHLRKQSLSVVVTVWELMKTLKK